MSVIKSQTESSESYSCTFDDLHDHFHHTDVNKLLFLVDEPQLDSGTNKNAIDNKTRLRDYVTITAIPDYAYTLDPYPGFRPYSLIHSRDFCQIVVPVL